jgi:hypothetical protein
MDIIKTDIEGSEFGALKGMTNLINANKKMKLFEFNLYPFDPSGTNMVLFCLECLYSEVGKRSHF